MIAIRGVKYRMMRKGMRRGEVCVMPGMRDKDGNGKQPW